MPSPFDSFSPVSLANSAEPAATGQNPTQNAENARLNELRRYNILDTPPEEAFDRITNLAARAFDVPIALISLVDTNRQWFKSCYGLGFSQTGRDVSFCSRAIEGDEVLVIPDATLDPRFADNPLVTGETHIRFYAGAPLQTSQGLALGSLCIMDTRPRQFSTEQRATLTDLAAIVVDELELRLAAQELEREAAERRVAQQALGESETYLSLALQEGKMGLWNVVLPVGTISWSPQMERLHDVEVGAFDGTLKMFRSLVHPDDWPFVAEISQRVLERGEEIHTEYRHISPQGEVRWLETRGTASLENGVPSRVTGITVDVTARKLAELELRESQIRFQNAFRYSPIGMALTSPQGRCLQVNRKLCEFLDASEEDLLQSEFWGRTHPDDVAANLELVQKALAGEISSYEIEKRYLHPDGREIWALLSASLVRDEAGEPQYFISQIQDISARKQAESDLRASEARKAAILKTALDCIITFDAQSRILEWNPAAEKTFGYSRSEAVGARLNDLIVPPELGAGHYAGIEHWAKTGEGSLLGQRLELPAVRADGERITVEMAIVPIANSGPPLFTGHLRDISERRANEERLRLLESVAVNANDAILITEAEPIDLPGPRILYANEAYLKMTGHTLEEIMGQTPRILQGEGTSDEARAKIRAALEKWQPIVIEVINYKKDGTPFWVELSITPVADETGWFTHWVSVQRDVTERRQIENALRES
ncbi:MAG: PAS domain S-box protein, partial [Armatimonadetes bacterium]|nr:PAS domain S-box protein [Armatimonadota bacterium]